MQKRKMRPSHPGSILSGVIEGLREETGKTFTLTEIASGLAISRSTLSSILNEKARISPELAVKLSEAFNTSADLWLNLQKKYDLWEAEKNVSRESVRHFVSEPQAGLLSA